MKADVKIEGDAVRVTPYGRISSDNSEQFQSIMNSALGDSMHIILDLNETEYISSSGLRVLLRTKQALGKTGTFKLVNVGKGIMEILEITGFDSILDIDESITSHSIKMAFFDVDGTLLPSDGVFPKSTVEALNKAQDSGLKLVIATGRDMTELSKLPLDGVDFDGFLTLNGNICLDKEKNFVAGNEIDPGEVEILVGIFRAGKIPFVLIGRDNRYINYVNDVVVNTQLMTNGTIPDIGEYNGGSIYQCLAFVDAEMRAKLEDLLDQCHITSWNDNGIDIIAKTGGKEHGIEKFIDHYGIKRSEILAAGDGENDIGMIKYAGTGVAMGNAGDKVKIAADYVTTDCDKDGIANMLSHFELI